GWPRTPQGSQAPQRVCDPLARKQKATRFGPDPAPPIFVGPPNVMFEPAPCTPPPIFVVLLKLKLAPFPPVTLPPILAGPAMATLVPSCPRRLLPIVVGPLNATFRPMDTLPLILVVPVTVWVPLPLPSIATSSPPPAVKSLLSP